MLVASFVSIARFFPQKLMAENLLKLPIYIADKTGLFHLAQRKTNESKSSSDGLYIILFVGLWKTFNID